jgi:hypothetical protein
VRSEKWEWLVRRTTCTEGGRVRRAGRAHSVRPESCDSPSSPEPAARWFGEGDCLLGGASAEPRDPGIVRRGACSEGGVVGGLAARTPCAGRAVMLPAVQSLRRLFGGGEGLLGGASAEPRDPGLGRRGGLVRRVACRRTPCAGRAVILPAVQSLRLACSEGGIACWVARVRSLAIPGLVGGGGLLGEGLSGAGPAGWLRESGSRLPQSKVTAAVTEGRLVGRGRVGWREYGASRSRAWSEGGACWERA